jgi:hypothetical protein
MPPRLQPLRDAGLLGAGACVPAQTPIFLLHQRLPWLTLLCTMPLTLYRVHSTCNP